MEMDFIPDASTLWLYSLACAVLFITPGPDMSLFLARTIARGRVQGIATMLGALSGCLVHTTLAAAGISALLAASETGFLALKVAGAGYLLWLAVRAVRSGTKLDLKPGPQEIASLGTAFATGIAVNLTNPKVVLFFVTFLPQFISAGDPHAAAKLAFLGVYFVLFSIPPSIALILGAERLVGYLKARPRVLRAIDYVFAGVFGVFAAKILATARP